MARFCNERPRSLSYGLFAAQFLAVLRAPRQIRFVNRLFGGLFVGAAALLATFKRGA